MESDTMELLRLMLAHLRPRLRPDHVARALSFS